VLERDVNASWGVIDLHGRGFNWDFTLKLDPNIEKSIKDLEKQINAMIYAPMVGCAFDGLPPGIYGLVCSCPRCAPSCTVAP
jgi:hypothetical protein